MKVNIYIMPVCLGLFLAFSPFMHSPAKAQQSMQGTWTAETGRNEPGKLHVSFVSRLRQGNSINGSDYFISDFRGLSADQVYGESAKVSFRLEREAGRIDCTGDFKKGAGRGEWVFYPDSAFTEGMKSRGFELRDEKLLAAAFLDITLAFADQVVSMGFKKLSADDIFKARIFKVDPSFAEEMKALGFPGLVLEDLVKAKIFKIDSAFAREIKEMGFKAGTLEEFVKLRIFKITPEFLRELKDSGFAEISAEEAIKLRIFKITPEFMKELKDEGLKDVSIEEAVRLKIHKVDAAFIRKAKSEGYNGLDVDQLVDLKINGRIRVSWE